MNCISVSALLLLVLLTSKISGTEKEVILTVGKGITWQAMFDAGLRQNTWVKESKRL